MLAQMGREVRHGFLLAVMAGLVPAIPIRMAYRVNERGITGTRAFGAAR